MTPSSGEAQYLKRLLADPRRICEVLGFADGAKPQANGVQIRYPWHDDRRPSCSVRVAPDGTIGVKCFACDQRGDVFSLVAVAHGLDVKRDFPEVLRRAADLAGTGLESPRAHRWLAPRPVPVEATFPPADEVEGLWAGARRVLDDAEVSSWLKDRRIDASQVEDFDLVRALPCDCAHPQWAGFGGRSWGMAGYRALLPCFDESGAMRSVRARAVFAGLDPKSVWPRGCSSRGLVLANSLGRTLLQTARGPEWWPDGVPLDVIVAEGDPDFLSQAVAFSDGDAAAPAVFGIFAGSWTGGIAARLPDGCRVVVRTHHDPAGDRLAEEIGTTLGDRCDVLREGRECNGRA